MGGREGVARFGTRNGVSEAVNIRLESYHSYMCYIVYCDMYLPADIMVIDTQFNFTVDTLIV